MKQVEFLDGLGIVDLISEKHKQLRKITMENINKQLDDALSEMDIYLIILNQHCALSVSESARFMNISRQAAHKHVKHLSASGLIELTTSELSRREKLINLTAEGERVTEQINLIKADLESQLEIELGSDNYQKIKTLFKLVWKA